MVEAQHRLFPWGEHPIAFRLCAPYCSSMNRNLKWSAVKLSVLLVAVGMLCTGCFIGREDDHDRDHHDQDRHDDQGHHDDQEHHDGN